MNRKTIIAAVLGVLAVIVVFWQLMPVLMPARPTPPPPPRPAVAPAAATPVSALDTDAEPDDALALADEYAQLIAKTDVRDLNFASSGLRNPFRPLVGPGSVSYEQALMDEARRLAAQYGEDMPRPVHPLELDYEIAGIVWNAGEPLVLINDQVLGVGEAIEEGGIITAITPNAVIVSLNGQSVTLPMVEE